MILYSCKCVFYSQFVLMICRQKQELTGGNVKGALCMRRPWPGMARTIYGDHDRFKNTYYKDFPGNTPPLELINLGSSNLFPLLLLKEILKVFVGVGRIQNSAPLVYIMR